MIDALAAALPHADAATARRIDDLLKRVVGAPPIDWTAAANNSALYDLEEQDARSLAGVDAELKALEARAADDGTGRDAAGQTWFAHEGLDAAQVEQRRAALAARRAELVEQIERSSEFPVSYWLHRAAQRNATPVGDSLVNLAQQRPRAQGIESGRARREERAPVAAVRRDVSVEARARGCGDPARGDRGSARSAARAPGGGTGGEDG